MPVIRRYRVLFNNGCRDDARVFTDHARIPVNLEGIPDQIDQRTACCYNLALRFQLDNPLWVLVHAIAHPPIGPYAGTDFYHAFVEYDGVVFDPVFAEFFPLQEFYNVYNITDPQKYDCATASRLVLSENHCGPWEG